MKLCAPDTSSPYDAKRKSESDVGSLSKKPRKEEHSFDLNFTVNSDIEEHTVPSDLTQEAEFNSRRLPQELLNSTVQLTLNACCGQYHEVKVNLLLKLHRAFDEMQNAKDEKWQLFIDPEVVEELTQAAGLFLESFFEKWVREVLQPCLLTVQRGGNLRLRLEGEERRNIEEFGFMASVLPNKINIELCCNL
ncbi:protein SMAX1-LIKE 4-like [Zingiber officinale]|uniref:protein SMAX1-LIKE 4-like n=1 Tax=Zingiber officinale TaxID=94328 RepID=UPI001C4D671B|nr:protein SMAX1-LIKE 4-like [Zingiber officinale]